MMWQVDINFRFISGVCVNLFAKLSSFFPSTLIQSNSNTVSQQTFTFDHGMLNNRQYGTHRLTPHSRFIKEVLTILHQNNALDRG